jgi:hypothetical protein
MMHAPADALASGPRSEGVVVQRAPAWIARRDRNLCLTVAGLAFGVYLLTLSRGVLGGDAGELQFVPSILGLTHPTGYPLQVLLHFAWSHLPIGTVAYRLNLLDALIAAGAVGVLVGLMRELGASRSASALAALSLAFGELWWSQAVRGDKYTLNGLFLALVLLLFLRWRARPTGGRLDILAFVFGLSLTHHRSMLLVAPALALGLLLAGWRPIPLRRLVVPLLLLIAPLSLYSYVPWAGGRGLPPGSWPVDSPTAFLEFLLDRGYTSQIRPDAAFGGRLLEEARVLFRSFGPLGAALGLIGVVASVRRDWRLVNVLLLVFLPQAILGASYLLESNYQLPRHWVFFLPGFLIWSVWLGLGLDAIVRWLTRRHPRRSTVLTSGIVVLVLLMQAGTAWARGAIVLIRSEAGAETMDAWRQDFQRSPIAERFGRLATDLADPHAIIVCDWEQATVLWYFQWVEGRRQDLTIRYPIERLDETLAEARATGRTVYITRTLPGVESRGVTSSHGPLLRVFLPSRTTSDAGGEGIRFDGGLTFLRLETHGWQPRPGGVVPVTLYWRADAPMPHAYAVSLRLSGPDGTVLAAHDERHPALGTSPTDRWPVGQIVGDYHELPIGVRLRPGTYQLQIVPYQVEPRRDLSWSIRAYVGGIDTPRQVTGTAYATSIEVGPPSVEHPLDLVTWLLSRR